MWKAVTNESKSCDENLRYSAASHLVSIFFKVFVHGHEHQDQTDHDTCVACLTLYPVKSKRGQLWICQKGEKTIRRILGKNNAVSPGSDVIVSQVEFVTLFV